jgi:ABC-type dipeptide/oligopeptide/nickel transport system permease subunit
MAPVIAIMLFCGSFYMLSRTLDEVVTPKLKEQ